MNNLNDVDQGIPENAVRVYGQDDGMDDFPVLKAFQQYINAEQAKARKRMLMLCTFFGFLMVVVISVFVLLLFNVNARNQELNDRLVEYAMRDRDRPSGAPVVVQPQQDLSAIVSLTAKIEELRKKLAEDQAAAAKAALEATERARKEAARPKAPSPEELEIKRLKALLAAEQEKNSAERAKQRQVEIEAYRRQHYPELYLDETKDDSGFDEEETPAKKPRRVLPRPSARQHVPRVEKDDDTLLDDIKAIRYFEDDEEEPRERSAGKVATESVSQSQKKFSIPVDVRGSSSEWSIPLE